jgi:hypothetical protein
MPRSSYLRSLTGGARRSAPPLRPVRPPFWGSTQLPAYEDAGHPTDPGMAPPPDADREAYLSTLPPEPRPGRTAHQSGVSIRGIAQHPSNFARVAESSVPPATEPVLVPQQLTKSGRQDQTPATTAEGSTAFAEAVTAIDKAPPPRPSARHVSRVRESKPERLDDLDRDSTASRLQPVVPRAVPQPPAMRSESHAQCSVKPASPAAENSSGGKTHIGDSTPDGAEAEGRRGGSRVSGARLKVRQASQWAAARDRASSLRREPSLLLPLMEQAREAARDVDEPPEGRRVHIGSVDIHITPVAAAIAPPVARTSPPVARTVISRGFTSSFGLRQA